MRCVCGNIIYMDKINGILEILPQKSGVYQMLDEFGNILYVGKAKNLRSRVRQYFRNNVQTEKTLVLVSKIKDIHYIITPSEIDALVLENNLIKQHRPPYNILLKDDKTYPYIKINMRSAYPTVEVTRRLKADGSRYFGPYMLGLSALEITKLLQSAFPIRSCNSAKFNSAKRECLNYHIGRCLAPCTKRVSEEEYKKVIKKVIDFLSGNNHELEQSLKDKMYAAAAEQEFETAKHYRDMLEMLSKLSRKQTMPFKLEFDLDIFSFATNGMLGAVNISAVRGGKLLGSQSFVVNDTNAESALSSFILQYYEKNPLLCSEIVISENFEFETELNDYLSSKAGRRLNIICPLGGIRRQLVEVSLGNAKDYLEKQASLLMRKEDLTTGSVKQLFELLWLKRPPRRMECYDISNISGTDKVASMVVFLDGSAAKKHYRHFKIKTVKGADDFASMRETLSRRFERLKKGDTDVSFSEKPDLIIIDGGKGQLSSAMQAYEASGLSDIEIISLAKREEEVFSPGQSQSVILPKDSLALKLLVRIRDEAHRFAIEHHRRLRQKRQTESVLKQIEGVGEVTARKLMLHFRDFDKLKAATEEELISIKGISSSVAQKIVEFMKTYRNTNLVEL
jgi:excinuclease ABC subunit C